MGKLKVFVKNRINIQFALAIKLLSVVAAHQIDATVNLVEDNATIDFPLDSFYADVPIRSDWIERIAASGKSHCAVEIDGSREL